MNYYVFTIEQIHNDDKLVEYATKSDTQPTRKSADIMFLDKCKSITADLSDNGHTYAKVWTTDAKGIIVDSREMGTYVEA